MASSLGQYSSRSASVASRAARCRTSFLVWNDTSGLALRFRYHIGLVARPPCDATRTMRLPSCRNSSGLSRASPDLRPVVVRMPTSAPRRNLFPNLPLVFLKIQVFARDIHLIAVPTLLEFRASICLGFSGRGVSAMWWTLSRQERPDAGADVVDLAVGRRDQKGLVDMRAHPAS